jgi:hypothetical protein
MALDERKLKAIENIINGETMTNVAKLSKVSRQALYDWIGDDEFKAELDRQVQEIKSQGQQRITSKLNTYINELEKIALTSNSPKLKADTLEYLIDRVLGRTTSRVADVTDDDNTKDKLDPDVLNNELDEFKGLINIADIKKDAL